jgi:hypothetical protein
MSGCAQKSAKPRRAQHLFCQVRIVASIALAFQNLERLGLGDALRAYAGHCPECTVHHKLLPLQHSIEINLVPKFPVFCHLDSGCPHQRCHRALPVAQAGAMRPRRHPVLLACISHRSKVRATAWLGFIRVRESDELQRASFSRSDRLSNLSCEAVPFELAL